MCGELKQYSGLVAKSDGRDHSGKLVRCKLAPELVIREFKINRVRVSPRSFGLRLAYDFSPSSSRQI